MAFECYFAATVANKKLGIVRNRIETNQKMWLGYRVNGWCVHVLHAFQCKILVVQSQKRYSGIRKGTEEDDGLKKRLPALQLRTGLQVAVYRHWIHYFSQQTNLKSIQWSCHVVVYSKWKNFFSQSLFKIWSSRWSMSKSFYVKLIKETSICGSSW